MRSDITRNADLVPEGEDKYDLKGFYVQGSWLINNADYYYNMSDAEFSQIDFRDVYKGASKRVAEILIQNQNGCGLSHTRFMIVRFGNVVGSVGSVVPLFKKQIVKGGPVTVTHPEMTRYFMTIPEACQLILQAGSMGNGGEIFLLDMGTSIKIDDMARDLIRLYGFEPDVDIKIEYIGLRPGEKLYEELITEGEGIVPTTHDKIMALKGTECDVHLLNGKIGELTKIAENQKAEEIKAKLQEIVPEYKPAQPVQIGKMS